MPIMNGDYSVTNFDATDMAVHFSMTGQIFRHLQNVLDGTKINKVTNFSSRKMTPNTRPGSKPGSVLVAALKCQGISVVAPPPQVSYI